MYQPIEKQRDKPENVTVIFESNKPINVLPHYYENMGNGGGRKICNIRILQSLLSGTIYFVKSQLILPITMQNLRNCRNCLHQILMLPDPY